ncbi:MAG: hypothetical protein LDL41_01675 [Coleofasciculus sp. S288]|nr:hypothetical protein [Coleofasciculus sp. S288]
MSAGLFNVAVDPYGVAYSPVRDNFNNLKIEKFNNVRLFKAVDVIRLRPKSILLGSSRTDIGLDPNHPAIANQNSYNLGLVGANMYEVRRYFEHALTNQPDIKTVVLGIDFFMFNEYIQNSPDFDEARLDQKTLTLRDSINVSFSMSALRTSLATVKSSAKSDAYYLYHPNGHRYVYGNKPDQPLKNKFRNMLTGFLRRNGYYAKHQISQKHLDALKAVVETCKERNIELKIFISPSHAAQFNAIKEAGLWSNFEDWKREIVKITPIWDFSSYNSITTEPISDGMKNYWDSSHYRKEVGDLVLNRLFQMQEEAIPNDFGVLLTTDTIEAHLKKVRTDQAAWEKNNPDVVKLVQDVKRNVDGER